MKQRFLKSTVILLLCVFLLGGCKPDSSEEYNEEPNVEFDLSVSERAQEDASLDEAKDENGVNGMNDNRTTMEVVIPPVTIEVPIYTINTETMDTKATIASIPDDAEITAELIVQLVVSDIGDKAYVIDVNQVTLEEDLVVVDLSSKTPPITNVNATTEVAILDAIAFSILDNLPEIKGIIYRMDGEAYKSQNYSFGENEVYTSK